jgi:hypothetical protein
MGTDADSVFSARLNVIKIISLRTYGKVTVERSRHSCGRSAHSSGRSSPSQVRQTLLRPDDRGRGGGLRFGTIVHAPQNVHKSGCASTDLTETFIYRLYLLTTVIHALARSHVDENGSYSG